MMISWKCSHIWGPMDPLSLSALVIPFIAVVQEMSHLAPSVMSVMSHNTTGNGWTHLDQSGPTLEMSAPPQFLAKNTPK